MTFTLNLTLTCYYFETVLSRDVNSPRLCNVNKDGGGVNDHFCKHEFDLLLSYGINSPRPCELNNEVDSVTSKINLTLTCYGKQSAILNFS
jgi:hypothetical protein